MKVIMVRYKVKPDQTEKNKDYIRKVFAALAKQAPANFRYSSFVMEDGVSFVHIVANSGDSNPLADLPEFKEFTAEIKARCEEPPVATPLQEVGAYNFFV